MQPTKDEMKNGWTEESLTLYLKEREKQNAEFVLRQGDKKPAIKIENVRDSFDPHKWLLEKD